MSGMQRFYEQEGEYVSIEELIDHVRSHPLSSGRIIPIIIWGGFGVGKTAQIKNYGKSRGLEVRTYHPAHDVNGADIVGKAYHDEASNETRYALPAWLPTEEDNPNGVLFIDELNRAPQEVLAGLMEPLGEGTIAQSGWKLPSGWNIIAAANPSEMGYMVQDLDEAMVDRMLHYAPGWDARYWGHWAKNNNIKEEIIDFALRHQGGLVSTGEAQLPLEIENKLRTTPRTLEYVSALYERGMPEGLLRVVSQGLMGRDAAEALEDLTRAEVRPLLPEEIVAEPQVDQAGQAYYPYEDRVYAWLREPTTGEELLRASTEMLVVSLIGQTCPSDDPRSNRAGSLIGRYLALLPGNLKEEALSSVARSAPDWSPVLSEGLIGWAGVLSKQQKVFIQQKSS